MKSFSRLKLRSSLARSSLILRFKHTRISSEFFNRNDEIVDNLYNKLLYQDYRYPIYCNFIQDIFDNWSDDTKKLAIRSVDLDDGETKEIPYVDITEKSYHISQYFKNKNFNIGDPVALLLGQKSAWWYSMVGLLRIGLSIVPCPSLLTENDLLYRINDLNIRGIITGPKSEHLINSIRSSCPSLVSTITTGSQKDQWESLDDIYKNQVIGKSRVRTTTHNPCLYLYTSGTTGQPKAVTHNYDYPFYHWPTGKRWLKATEDDLVYNASDTGWGFTVWITMGVWATGAKLLITPSTKKFSPQKMLSILSEEPVTIFCAAPTVLRMLVAEKNFNTYKFPKLRRIVTVGEALDETVIQIFENRGIEVAVGFGQAETPLLMGRVDDQKHEPGTMGQPLEHYGIKLLDNDLNPVPNGSVGQIAVNISENNRLGIMRGYANAPEKTKAAFTPDKTKYLTGDWARLKDGYFTYEGRKDDLMKVRGYRIGPDEVEKAGMSHPAIAKIAVVAISLENNVYAKEIKAFILLKPGYEPNSNLIKSIQNHIKNETAPHKYPRSIEFLPKHIWEKYETTSGKIRRVALRDRDQKVGKSDIALETSVNTNSKMKI